MSVKVTVSPRRDTSWRSEREGHVGSEQTDGQGGGVQRLWRHGHDATVRQGRHAGASP